MESGSVEDVTERLKSWCTLHDHGLVRVEWDSAYARQEVVDRLKNSLPVVEIDLPPGEAGYETASRLIEKLQSRSGSVVSITGIEWAFPEGGNRLETLVALSFRRETLASLPVRQVWWIPSSMTERFVLGVPDLDSWFRLKLHLTEAPRQAAKREESGRATLSVAEARSIARRFWERLESARAQNVPEERIWAELAQPAVEALRSVGLELEADAILASTPDARERLERKVEEARATRSLEDPEVLALTERLASLLYEQEDLAGARRLQEQVLAARERVYGKENRATLTSMNNLALTLSAQGDHAGARRIEERVLEVSTRVLGEEHPDTLTSMNNLSGTLRAQGDHAGARRLQERVLEVSTRVLGEEHPDTLRSMSSLAETLRAQGDLAGTRRLEQRVLEVCARVLGEEHPRTLRSMSSLATTLWAQGDRARAVELLRKGLAGQRKILGADHPDTVATAGRLKEWEARQ